MTRERPVSIFILALGSLIVGGVCLFVGIARTGNAILMLALPPGSAENTYFAAKGDRTVPVPDFDTYLELEVPGYPAWETAMTVSTLAAGVVVLVWSVGLLHMRPWARWLAGLYALATCAWQATYFVFQIRRVLPTAEIYFLDESWRTYYWMPNDTGLARPIFIVFAAVPAVLLTAHALVVMLVLCLPTVRRAFAGQPEPAAMRPISAESRVETASSSV